MLYDLTKYRFTNEFILMNDKKANIHTDAPFPFYPGDEVRLKVNGEYITCMIKSVQDYLLTNKTLSVFLPQ